VIRLVILKKGEHMSGLIVEVCKVDKIEKHPNADKLSVVSIKGWNCIVGLDQYKQDELVVFVPPDSIIPPELIEKYQLTYLKKDGRVGSTRLRGLLSQGLILDLPEGKWKEGDDCSQTLGIVKWMPPEPPVMRGVRQVSKKRINLNFDKYTDIENIKHYNDVFTEDDLVVITEKIHGSNARWSNLEITLNKNQPFFYKARTWFKNNFYGEDIWGKIGQKYNMKEILPKDYIVYGEIFGVGIQDLTYGLKDVDMRVFDIKYKNKYLNWDEVVDFCHENNFPHVPVLYIGQFDKDVLQNLTIGNSLLQESQIREGCVVKTYYETNDPKIGRKILKSINPEYLLRKNGTEFK
jgi:RNA ligase (TIGR02306 family)